MKTNVTLMHILVPALLLAVCACSAAPLRYHHWRNALKPQGEPAGEIALSVSGETEYQIVIPAEPTTQEQKAAEELAHWLNEMTGAEFPVVDDTQARRDTEICLGRVDASPDEAAADLGDEGYSIAVDGKKLRLTGGRKRGPIYAVFALLEEDLGCRWYTAEAIRIPRRPTVRFKPVPRSFVPALTIRDPFYHDAFNGEWSLRNRTNAPSATVSEEWGGHVTYAMFVHTYNTLVPPGEYFDKNPELFMQNEAGNRTARQLCQTNPETIRIATETCLRVLRDKPTSKVISVSKNDGGGSCVCENCKAIDEAEGTDCGSLLHFVNAVAEGIEGEFPEVIVSTLAYLETMKAPKTIRPRHNVAIRLCTDRCMWAHPFTPARQSDIFGPAMLEWASVHDQIHIWDYCVNFSHYTAPMPNFEVVADNIRFFVENNCTGVMLQGAYQSSGAERELMRCWVFGKLLWDPSLDVDALTEDFIWGYYGKAAPAILEYDKLLQQAGKDHAESLAAPEGGIRYAMDSEFLSRDFLWRAEGLFDRAEKLAENDEIRRRVELARAPIMYVNLVRGPDFVGEGYLALIDRFEAVANRENITHIYEGAPDVKNKIKTWRDEIRVQAELQKARQSDMKILPLPSEWRFATDPKDTGTGAKWFAPEFDDSAWVTVRNDVDTGWETQGFADYAGLGWYRQQFSPAELPAKKHLYLFFEAVDEDATVYIDGKLAFEHTCASTGLAPDQIWITPFMFEVKDILKAGQPATIAVKVLNRMGMGGVYKPVRLIATDHDLNAAITARLLAEGPGE